MNPQDGGAAFPFECIEDPDAEGCFYGGQPGMTLRDYFAAKAMQALLREANSHDGSWHVEADASYQIADAMIKARAA